MDLNREFFSAIIFYNSATVKLHRGPLFIDGRVNSIMVVVDEFLEDLPKLVVFPEAIDAVVRELIAKSSCDLS